MIAYWIRWFLVCAIVDLGYSAITIVIQEFRLFHLAMKCDGRTISDECFRNLEVGDTLLIWDEKEPNLQLRPHDWERFHHLNRYVVERSAFSGYLHLSCKETGFQFCMGEPHTYPIYRVIKRGYK